MTSPNDVPESRSLKEKYADKVDADGYVLTSEFAVRELRAQNKSVASLLDGEEGLAPEYNLGVGLRYRGESGNYPTMKIHIDDVDEFVQRVKKHYGMI